MLAVDPSNWAVCHRVDVDVVRNEPDGGVSGDLEVAEKSLKFLQVAL